MISTLVTVFYLAALICFALSVPPAPEPSWRNRLVPAGLFFWLLANLIAGGAK